MPPPMSARHRAKESTQGEISSEIEHSGLTAMRFQVKVLHPEETQTGKELEKGVTASRDSTRKPPSSRHPSPNGNLSEYVFPRTKKEPTT